MTIPKPGDLFAQRFLIDSHIGAGGMGTVFRATDQQTGATIALKLVDALGDTLEAERFTREAQILAELSSVHIVSYVAHGIDAFHQPYLAMEWLEGEDLSHTLRRGRMGLAEALTLMRGVALALSEAHRSGIIHRDLKPSNLILRGGNPARVVVLDFGIARALVHHHSLTGTGTLLGTPGYMAPEQARGERNLGPAVDIFSLGCVFFECLTGQPLFSGAHPAAVLTKVLFEDPPALEALCSRVPDEIARVLVKMVCKDPLERFPHGMALYEAIGRLEAYVDPAAETDHFTMPERLSLTTQEEQRVFSLAFATKPRTRGKQTGDDFRNDSAILASLRQSLRALGAEVEMLVDGSIVAGISSTGSATDQVFMAARYGLLLKQALPENEVAVTTGRGVWRGRIPIGEVIDRATQLLSEATLRDAPTTTNGVWLDDLTENLLTGRFDITRQHGRAMLIRDQNPTNGEEIRRLLGHVTPYVGRDQELALLTTTLSVCIGDGVARAVAVIAPPGMGKSRLRYEFLRTAMRLHPEMVLVFGRGDLVNPGAPYGILGNGLRRLCDLVGGESLDLQRERFRARIERHLPRESSARIVAFVGEMCRIPFPDSGMPELQAARHDPKIMQDQIAQAFMSWIRAELETAPLLLVLEDLHWGDAPTLRLVEQALREFSELSFCFMTFARPEAQQSFPTFWTLPGLQIVRMAPLSRKACERLAQDVLRKALGSAIDPETIARVVMQSAGHPLFLEELVRGVAENRNDELPETVLAMLDARLSQLEAGARQVLRAASVFGEAFTRGGVERLVDRAGPENALDTTLEALVRGEFIEKLRDAKETGHARFRFRHALVRDAAYGSWTDENRIVAHRLACQYLKNMPDADPAMLADHAFKGQDLRFAAKYYLEAAKQVLAACDPDMTIRHCGKALDCGLEGSEVGTIHAILAWAHHFKFEQIEGYEHAIKAVDLLEPGTFWWIKGVGISFYSFFLLNRLEHSERLISGFLQAEPAEDARLGYLEAGHSLSVFCAIAGEGRTSEFLIQKLERVAANLEAHEKASLHQARGWWILFGVPNPYAGIVEMRTAGELFRRNGDRYWYPQTMMGLGMLLASLGSAEGERILRESRAMALQARNMFYAFIAHMHLGLELALSPDKEKQEEARALALTYIAQPEVGPAAMGVAYHILARVLRQNGDIEGARDAAEKSLMYVERLVPYWLSVKATQVTILSALGEKQEAARLGNEALVRLANHAQMGFGEMDLRWAATKARFAAGDVEGGIAALRETFKQMQLRAKGIEEPALLRSYLDLPENRELVELARVHGLMP